MIDRYLHTSKALKAVFMLVDIRHDPGENDKTMYEWIRSRGYTPVIIATKADKIKRSQLSKQVRALREGLGLQDEDICIPFSSETKQGRDEVWSYVDSLVLPQQEA